MLRPLSSLIMTRFPWDPSSLTTVTLPSFHPNTSREFWTPSWSIKTLILLFRKSMTPRVSGGGLGQSYRCGNTKKILNKFTAFLAQKQWQQISSCWHFFTFLLKKVTFSNNSWVLLTAPVPLQIWPGPLPLGGRGLAGLRAHGGRSRLRPGDAPGPLQRRSRGHWGRGGRGKARQPRRPRVSLPGITQTELSPLREVLKMSMTEDSGVTLVFFLTWMYCTIESPRDINRPMSTLFVNNLTWAENDDVSCLTVMHSWTVVQSIAEDGHVSRLVSNHGKKINVNIRKIWVILLSINVSLSRGWW